ncbi:cytochrome c oxidase subunit II [Nitratireductor basaltis]|uniref:Cytochrome c oxidase, subunit II n=1 Tax=Nitratireductor basaltis TaxID=472175 RepID=A0A084UB02_9HYPH|nr:c-type cytochrome [Nitratireductor basaltis]KFB10138.1 Cytochrome c oxidase, subunit II precursor [Nitratireductor basaltis]
MRLLHLLIVVSVLLVSGCAGQQSVLEATGREAGEVEALFWIATGISAVVTLLMVGLTLTALSRNQRWRGIISHERTILLGGIAFPVIVLTYLFIHSTLLLEAGSSRSVENGEPTITMAGELWWWDVIYNGPDGEIRSANELRLPVGRPVSIRLVSDNVIHSFWAPQLAGKLDMIPGRENVITLQANEAGISRGQCAEYCGGAHALMSFHVVAMAADEYESWLQKESGPAEEPASPLEERGHTVFQQSGCGACHTIRGTDARGVIGPDLTHMGSRHSLAAATLPNNPDAIAAWITDNQHYKPDNKMPEYEMLAEDDLEALSAYLAGLE